MDRSAHVSLSTWRSKHTQKQRRGHYKVWEIWASPTLQIRRQKPDFQGTAKSPPWEYFCTFFKYTAALNFMDAIPLQMPSSSVAPLIWILESRSRSTQLRGLGNSRWGFWQWVARRARSAPARGEELQIMHPRPKYCHQEKRWFWDGEKETEGGFCIDIAKRGDLNRDDGKWAWGCAASKMRPHFCPSLPKCLSSRCDGGVGEANEADVIWLQKAGSLKSHSGLNKNMTWCKPSQKCAV